MPRNQRPRKGSKSIRLAPPYLEILAILSKKKEISEGRVVEEALGEYFRNHPEYWPAEAEKQSREAA